MLSYFVNGWNYLDILSLLLSGTTIALWVAIVAVSMGSFDLTLTYRTYAPWKGRYDARTPLPCRERETPVGDTCPLTRANVRVGCSALGQGRLIMQTGEWERLFKHFRTLKRIGMFQSIYISLAGINVFIFLLRILKQLHFQPQVRLRPLCSNQPSAPRNVDGAALSQMGILTRTIAKAMDDLLHFVVLLTIVFTIYTVMGYIVFGPTMAGFSEMGLSAKTVFNMLIGEFASTEDELLSKVSEPKPTKDSG